MNTSRKFVFTSAGTKLLVMAGLYFILITLLSGQWNLKIGIEIVRQMAQANGLLYILLVLPLALVIPLLGDLRLILESRRITFDVAQNKVRLNHRVLAALTDITQVRIRDEHVKSGLIHHLVIVFCTGPAFELESSHEDVPLIDHAQRIADFLKVPLQLPHTKP